MGLTEIIATALITGATSTAATVIALRVHISYLREAVQRIERSTTRAHERIDEMKKRAVT